MNASEEVFETKIKAAQEKVSAQDEEAISALMGLGFTKNESVQAVQRAKEAGAKTTEDVIRKALTGM